MPSRPAVRRTRRAAAALSALLLAAAASPALAEHASAAISSTPSCTSQRWVSSWYAAPGDATMSQPPLEQTFRIQVRPLRGGSVARFRLSNRFGHAPVTFGAATVGEQAAAQSPAIRPGTLHQITFGGARSVTVPAGKDLPSDPVRMRFATFRTLLVSLHVKGSPGPATQHGIAEQTTWQTPPAAGDHTRDLGSTGFVGLPVRGVTPAVPQAIPYLDGVDVQAPRRVGTVVAFGDSITDGTQSSYLPVVLSSKNIDQFASYPDQLAHRIAAAGLPFSVANGAISGNELLQDSQVPIFGPAGLSRFGQDALDLPAATTVILLEGINDVGQSLATRDDVVDGYEKAIAAAHARGIHLLLGTLTPQNGATQPPGYGAAAEPTRVAINRWIRTQRLSDGVVDFDKAVRDPSDPSRIRPAYDGGDHLHFNAAGYRAMAAAVPLSRLGGVVCR